MSDSTMRRIIFEYLDSRNLRIVFKQNDHNASHNCNFLQYAILQFHHEGKESQERLNRIIRDSTPANGVETYRLILRARNLFNRCRFTSGRSGTRRRKLYGK